MKKTICALAFTLLGLVGCNGSKLIWSGDIGDKHFNVYTEVNAPYHYRINCEKGFGTSIYYADSKDKESKVIILYDNGSGILGDQRCDAVTVKSLQDDGKYKTIGFTSDKYINESGQKVLLSNQHELKETIDEKFKSYNEVYQRVMKQAMSKLKEEL